MDNPDTPWGDPDCLLGPPGLGLTSTANGPNLALVFSGATAELGVGDDAPSRVAAFALRVPLDVPAERTLVGFVTTVSLGVTKTPGARAALLLDLGGTTKVIEVGYDDPKTPPRSEPLRLERVFSVQGLESAGDGMLGLAGPAAYEVAVLLVVQRRGPEESVILALSGLDVDPILGS
jgi:hypothetical protein